MGRRKTRKTRETIDLLDGLLDLGMKFYTFVEGEVEKHRPQVAVTEKTDPYQVLGIDPALPAPEKKKRYWRLQHLVHTDHGGDQHLSKLINDAWEELCRREGI